MKHILRRVLVLTAMISLALRSHAGVYIDDTWTDGTRTDPASPTYSEQGTDADADGDIESAWFSSASGSLVAASKSLTVSVGGSAILGVTYFTSNSVGPAQLNIGDTLAATFHLTFNNVPASNGSQGFRIGLFDYADSTLSPKRVTNDGSISGNNVLGNGVNGYALFQNMGTAFNSTSPIDIRKRTVISDSHLLGTSSDWTSQGTGPGSTNGFGGFANGINYTLQLSLQRTGSNSMAITVSWLDPTNSVSLTTTVIDNLATNFNFDAIALRPQDNTSAAGTIIFTEARVELIPGSTPPSISINPQDQAVLVGQDASFNVLASGTLPLFYQWYTNTDTVLTSATNSMLTVTNAQLLDSGSYDVIVSNAYGSVTSAVAQLTVSLPVAPSISTQPQDQINVLPGASATFTVVAGGSDPLSYQWYYNTSTPVANANDSTLTITNVQLSDAGIYSVVVSNLVGTATSSNAVLTVNTNPVAPVFTSQPASQVVLAGSTVSFSALAAGTAPISYQWNKDSVAIPGATSSTLTLSNVQVAADGNYSVTAANSAGSAISSNAVLTVTAAIPVPNTAYNLVGFGQGITTGGGVLPDTDPNYAKVYTATDLANALSSKTVKIIEIMNDLNLGYNEIEASAKVNSEPFRAHNAPKLHPVLLTKGVSLIDIQKKNGLTIFSANGSTIRHATFNIKSSANVIVRNLKFDELWEWDEASKGDYDKNDWDFIDLGNSGTVSNIWIDHCTFTKSYDGIVDVKDASYNITFSWCKYTGDDGATNTNSWVRQQINNLELSPSSYPMYNFLRTHGFSVEDIVTIIQGHDKTHLVGATTDSANAAFRITFHHQWFMNPWDRCVPRLRAGNVHDYNIYVDDILGLAAKRLRDTRAAAMSPADRSTLNNTYSFNPFLNGSISTEGGALLVEKSVYIDCLTPLRNNQTDPSNPTYTGKIKALDTIYQMDSTVVRGNSTDPSNPLGPFQAPIIVFSWNLPGGVLPYSYTMDDPAQLQAIVTSPTAGAGAGVLTWNKTNWLVTSYAPTAPVIVADPQSQTVALSNDVSFTVVAGGSAPLTYQWYFNTSSLLANATNATLTITSAQSTNVGSYSVVVSNSAGTATSANATLALLASPVAGFTASPLNGTEPLSVTFTDQSTGSPLPNLSWDFGDNTTTNTASGASFAYTYAAGTYTVTLTASNSVGTSTLVSNSLITATVATNAFQSWQLSHFNCTNCPQADATADPDGDGLNNLAEFLSGSDPNNSSSGLHIISVAPQHNGDVLITWRTVGGYTNAVQATTGDASVGYNTNFVDITTSPHIIVSGSGDVTTNYTDGGGATNVPSRFYRVRLVP